MDFPSCKLEIKLEIYLFLGDGFIDGKDLRKTLTQLRVKFTESDVQEMISEFSRRKKLNFDDFMNIVGRNAND